LLTPCLSIQAQKVKLLKSGNDTIAILPLRIIRNINSQLSEARAIKIDYYRLKSQLNKNNKLIIRKDSMINIRTNQIKTQSLVILKHEKTLKKQDWQLLKYMGMYERTQKKNKKLKRFILGGSILGAGILGLILVSTI